MTPDCKRCQRYGSTCINCERKRDAEADKRIVEQERKEREAKKPETWMERDAAHNAQRELLRAQRRLDAVRRGSNMTEAAMLDKHVSTRQEISETEQAVPPK